MPRDKPPWPGERNKVVLSQANGTFLIRDASPEVGFFHGATAADLNADGHADVMVVNNLDPEKAFVLLNKGAGQFRREKPGGLPTAVAGKSYFSIELVDVSGDGKLDLCIGGHEYTRSSSTLVAINSGDNIFSQV